MTEIPRLNGVIRALEQGQCALTSFASVDVEAALAFGSSQYDGRRCSRANMHHGIRAACATRCNTCSIALKILKTGTPAPAVTPLARIRVNGVEKNQSLPNKRWISDVTELSGRTSQLLRKRIMPWRPVDTRARRANRSTSLQASGGTGRQPRRAYWGVGQQEYYRRADVCGHSPSQGELLVIIQIEGHGPEIRNLPDMLANVPGIGAVLIGEGDLSQQLGYPRQYEPQGSPRRHVRNCLDCKKYDVVVGHPRVEMENMARVVPKAYLSLARARSLFLMCSAAPIDLRKAE